MNKGTAPTALLQVLLVLQLPLQKWQVLPMNIPRKSSNGAPSCPSVRQLRQLGWYHSRGTEWTVSEARSTSFRTRVRFALSYTRLHFDTSQSAWSRSENRWTTSSSADTETKSSSGKTAEFYRGFRQLLKHEFQYDWHVTSNWPWQFLRETFASKHLNLKLAQSRYN